MKLNNYVITYDIILNSILIYVIKGFGAELPSPSTAVAFVAIHNAITTFLLLIPGFKLQNIFKIIREDEKSVHVSIIVYTTVKLLLIAVVCMLGNAR